MSAAADPAAAPTDKPAGKRGRKLVLALVCIVCVGGGAAVPMVLPVSGLFAKDKGEAEAKPHGDGKTVIVPFGDVVVNLAEERMTRYLRLKVAVLVDAESEKDVTEKLTKQKAAVKSKLIAHLAGKSLKDVSGSVGVNRLQREVLEWFEDVLYPDGGSHIRAVLFEEYVVQ
jgi:flagellar basal body-associated protein FliL